ncbi:MAG: Glycosyltransferase [Parcubacteria bacterium C7867-008]|nr:MAG: Glycosyltransferase [Parcubacteria bacterium C7867-008]
MATDGERDFSLQLGVPTNFFRLGCTSYIQAVLFYLTHRKKLQQYDLIHCFVEPYAPFAMYLSRLLHIPFFITVHGSYAVRTLGNDWFGMMQRHAYRAAAKIFCVSTYTQTALLKRIDVTNTEVIPNGINSSVFKKRIRTSNKQIILGVGALKKRKGFHLVIDAMPEVLRAIPDATYYLVGDDSNKEYVGMLQQRIAELGLTHSVQICGQLSEEKLHELYSEAALFVLTSVSTENDFEGFGLVFLEANAVGIPVIGMKGSGAEQAIKDGYSGLLIEENNVTDLSAKIVQVLADKSGAEALVANGYNWATAHDWSRIVEKYLELYSSGPID